jgi:hypothetical protein
VGFDTGKSAGKSLSRFKFMSFFLYNFDKKKGWISTINRTLLIRSKSSLLYQGGLRSLNLKYETDEEAQVNPLKGNLRVCIRGGN